MDYNGETSSGKLRRFYVCLTFFKEVLISHIEFLASASFLCYNQIVRCIDEWWSDNQREFSLLGTWVSAIAGSHAHWIRHCREGGFALVAHTQE
jgi:hypothetical protein